MHRLLPKRLILNAAKKSWAYDSFPLINAANDPLCGIDISPRRFIDPSKMTNSAVSAVPKATHATKSNPDKTRIRQPAACVAWRHEPGGDRHYLYSSNRSRARQTARRSQRCHPDAEPGKAPVST